MTTLARLEQLYASAVATPEARAQAGEAARKILANKQRYLNACGPLAIPWQVVACIHYRESSLRWSGHLHNGDPLSAKTRNVPAGRPRDGYPPYSWEESARDALAMAWDDFGWRGILDWTPAIMLDALEEYNGFGYRRRGVLSPYLWAGTQHYQRGKYTSDGRYDPAAVDRQLGCAAILRQLNVAATRPSVPLVRFSVDPLPGAAELQAFLRAVGEPVAVDGIPGPQTSEATRRVLGHRLHGDPSSD